MISKSVQNKVDILRECYHLIVFTDLSGSGKQIPLQLAALYRW